MHEPSYAPLLCASLCQCAFPAWPRWRTACGKARSRTPCGESLLHGCGHHLVSAAQRDSDPAAEYRAAADHHGRSGSTLRSRKNAREAAAFCRPAGMEAHRTALTWKTPPSSLGSTRLPAEPEHSVERCAVARAALLPELLQPVAVASSSPEHDGRSPGRPARRSSPPAAPSGGYARASR